MKLGLQDIGGLLRTMSTTLACSDAFCRPAFWDGAILLVSLAEESRSIIRRLGASTPPRHDDGAVAHPPLMWEEPHPPPRHPKLIPQDSRPVRFPSPSCCQLYIPSLEGIHKGATTFPTCALCRGVLTLFTAVNQCVDGYL